MTTSTTRGRRSRRGYRHPVNQQLYGAPPMGARIADAVTTFIGSWKFLVIQTVIVAFSTQAAYAAPLILLAGSRQSVHDRMTLEHAADQADVEEQQNEHLLNDDKEILEHVAALEQRILELEAKILAEIRGSGARPAG